MSHLGAIRDAAGSGRHLARIAGLVEQPPQVLGASFSEYLQRSRASTPPDVTTPEIWTLAGAIGGGLVGSRYKHPWLGVLAGASAGRNLPALALRPEERELALCNLAQTGGGVAASLMFKAHPAWGFILGYIGAGLAIHLGGFRK